MTDEPSHADSTATTDGLSTVTLRDGRALGYLRIGTGAQPLLYLHGFPGSHHEARVTEEAAHALDLSIFAVDRPGFAASDHHPVRTFATFATDLFDFKRALGIGPAPVLAVSGGVPYAVQFARHFPDEVTRLVLVSGMGPLHLAGIGQRSLLGEMALGNRAVLSLGLAVPALGSALVKIMGRISGTDPRRMVQWMSAWVDPTDRAILADPDLRRLMEENIRAGLSHGAAGAVRDYELLISRWGEELGEIRAPASIWHGTADRYVPVAFARLYQDRLPNAELFLEEGAGHLMALTRARKILEHLRASLG